MLHYFLVFTLEKYRIGVNISYKYSVSLGAFDLHRGRFCKYGRSRRLEESVKIASSIENLDGVSTTYHPSIDVDILKKVLEKYNLGFPYFTVDLSRDSIWLNNSLTSPNPKIRKTAVERIKNCIDATLKMGGSLVNVCPMGGGLKEVCSYNSECKDLDRI